VSLLSILLLGFLLGMKHATEIDHLAAVATLAAGRQTLSHTLRQGVAWGVGHTLTLMLFGSIVLLLGKSIPATLERSLELAVGLMLIALGADVLRRLARDKIHIHAHDHAPDVRHVHAHSHLTDASTQARHVTHDHDHDHDHDQANRGWLPLRALMVGMMHGMAGTAALILISLEAVQSLALGLVYIALFGFGSIVGMAALSTVIALPLRLSVGRLAWLHHGISVAFGAFSCLLGVSMVYRIGFVEGLLV
jgi:hypothetical protein